MVLYELGYPAIAFNSEGIPTRGESASTVEEVIQQLKERFERVILFLDNDIPGINYSKKISKRYNIPYIVLPDGPKDISDHINKYNKRKTKRTLNKLISKLVINELKPVEYLDLATSINDSVLRRTDVESGHVVSEP
jgi:DNA primase